MKTAELRVGNKIRYTDHILTVSELRKNGYVVTDEGICGYLDEYDGIALSPAILEAFPAEYKDNNGNTYVSNGKSAWGEEVIFLWNDDHLIQVVRYLLNVIPVGSKIYFLHDLQNRYYSLTQTELEVNLPHP